MSLIIWSYIFGGATIFGLIVAIFSVWNGRMTRRELSLLAERIATDGEQSRQRLFQESQARQERLFKELRESQEHFFFEAQQSRQQLSQHMVEMDKRFTSFFERLLARNG